MKSPRSTDIIWIFGNLLGVGSVLAAMYLDNKSVLVAADYKGVLPSLVFISASNAIMAVAEAFELAFRFDKSKVKDDDISWRIALVATNILLAMWFIVLFVKDISKSSNATYIVDRWDVGLAYFCVFLSLTITLSLRRAMRIDA